MADYKDCVKELGQAQTADHDNREAMREADLFLNKRDGQWEPEIISKFSGKPRYTFDECNPIVDDIMGEMETMDFDIRVNPAGGDSSKETAQYFEGIIRNIENISSARFIYNSSARIMVGTGMNAWRVVQAYRDDDSFNQDLLIKRIPNVEDSLWYDPQASEPDMSDADFAWVLSSLTSRDYWKKFPDGSGASVGTDVTAQAYSYKKPDEIIVGEYLYRKQKKRELGLLSNGSVVVIDDDFDSVRDELLAQDIRVMRTRVRPYHVVYQRVFDGSDYLTEEKETVFEYIPCIPVYGNFRISENKVIYWGITEKLMDPQRIINYAESRNIEEGAFNPRAKVWMSKDQAKSPDVKKSLRTLNTNSEPVQFYDHQPDQLPPSQMGSNTTNPALQTTSQNAQNFIQRSSGTFDEARGSAPANRSGVAIDKLQMKSDNPKRKWFSSMEVALCHTCRILIKAIPKVYDTQQEMRLINPDGTTDTVTIKDVVVDEQTGQPVEINDLSKGQYDVTCKAGPAFHSRQQETVSAINEIATIDPSIMALGGDILLNNINSPGIEQIAERKRAQMLQQGLIPMEQMTDDEKAAAEAAANQPSAPDAMMVAAQAEQKKADNQAIQQQMKFELEQNKIVLQQMKLQSDVEAQNSKQMLQAIQLQTEQIQAQADALKTIREALGVDTAVTSAGMRSLEEQSRNLEQSVNKQ